jgi:hypothetical protein
MRVGLSVPVMDEPSALVDLGVSAEGGIDLLPPEAVTDVAARPDAPADIVVAAPAGTDPASYDGTGATWVLLTGWLGELRELAATPAPQA